MDPDAPMYVYESDDADADYDDESEGGHADTPGGGAALAARGSHGPGTRGPAHGGRMHAPLLAAPRGAAAVAEFAPPRELFPLLVKVIVQTANPASAVPERRRAQGVVVDLVSASIDSDTSDLGHRTDGRHALPAAPPQHHVELVTEYCHRYRITQLGREAVFLAVYAQNLVSASPQTVMAARVC